MRQVKGFLLLCSAYALVACGASATQEVQAKVQEFAHATAGGDYRTLCDDVLSPNLIIKLRATGSTCDQAMKVFVASVSDPSISVSKIVVHGSTASAVVLAGARGQTATLTKIELVDTPNGWRLASLASPAASS